MANAGTAYLRVMPVFQGNAATLANQMGGGEAGLLAGRAAGNGFAAGIGEGLKSAANLTLGAVGVIGGAIAGMGLKGGLARSLNLDEAQAKFRALGYDVPAVMKIISDSVDGTRFSLDAAATAAVGFIAAGYEGKELERVLRLVQDAAALANVDMAEMSPVFQKAASSGRIMGDLLRQLEMNGVPATSALAKHLGITAQEVRDLAADSKIDFATFQDAMEKAFGGMATNADSFSSFVSLIKANVAKIGALFTTPLVNAGRAVMIGFIPALKAVKVHFEPLGQMFNDKLLLITPKITDAVIHLTEAVGRMADKFASANSPLKAFTGLMGPLLGTLTGLVAGPLGRVISMVPGLGAFGGALSSITGPTGLVIGLLIQLAATSGGLDNLGASMVGLVNNFARMTSEAISHLPGLLQTVSGFITSAIAAVVAAIPQVAAVLPGALMQIITAFSAVKGDVLAAGLAIFKALFAGVTTLIKWVIPGLAKLLPEIARAIATNLGKSFGLVFDFAKTLWASVVESAKIIFPSSPRQCLKSLVVSSPRSVCCGRKSSAPGKPYGRALPPPLVSCCRSSFALSRRSSTLFAARLRNMRR